MQTPRTEAEAKEQQRASLYLDERGAIGSLEEVESISSGGVMTAYNPKVIVQFADQLYRRARWIVLQYALSGVALGAVLGGVLAAAGERSTRTALALFCAAIGGGMGFERGREKTFLLRLQAQQALCQVQIEANTRRHGASAAPILGEEPRGYTG